MARPATDEALDECGLTYLDVAVTAARVLGLSTGMAADIDAEHEGWLAVAQCAGAHFQTPDETEQSMTFTQFARLLHKAFARVGDPDRELPGFDNLDRPIQIGWTAVARHMANVFNMEPSDARRLETHEGQMADWAHRQLATP